MNKGIVLNILFRRKSIKLSTLLWLLLISVLFTSIGEAKRWIWARGDHRGGCTEHRVAFEEGLTRTLIELLHVEIMFDGQALTCDSPTCARARAQSAGAELSLLGKSRCLKGILDYNVLLVTDQEEEPPLEYIRTIKTDEPIKSAQEHGRRIAQRIVKGPALSTPVQPKQDVHLFGVGMGLEVIDPSSEGYLGWVVHSDVSSYLIQSKLLYRFGLSLGQIDTESFKKWALGLDLSLIWLPLKDGLSPFFAIGVTPELTALSRLKTSTRDLDSEGLIKLKVKQAESDFWINFSPLLESGIQWSGGRLKPAFTLRFQPYSITDELPWSSLRFLFSLRW